MVVRSHATLVKLVLVVWSPLITTRIGLIAPVPLPFVASSTHRLDRPRTGVRTYSSLVTNDVERGWCDLVLLASVKLLRPIRSICRWCCPILNGSSRRVHRLPLKLTYLVCWVH